MRNVHEVLREKKLDLVRVRQEVEALRLVAPMLTDRNDQFRDAVELSRPEPNRQNRWPLQVADSRQSSLG